MGTNMGPATMGFQELNKKKSVFITHLQEEILPVSGSPGKRV